MWLAFSVECAPYSIELILDIKVILLCLDYNCFVEGDMEDNLFVSLGNGGMRDAVALR